MANTTNRDFAIIATGGKQYLVSEGDVITIEKITGEAKGNTVKFDQVLLTGKGGNLSIGTPTVSGAKVEGTIEEEGRAKKIDVIKYKQKSKYFKKNGHRQPFMKVKIVSVA